jgi:hypothetical protein
MPALAGHEDPHAEECPASGWSEPESAGLAVTFPGRPSMSVAGTQGVRALRRASAVQGRVLRLMMPAAAVSGSMSPAQRPRAGGFARGRAQLWAAQVAKAHGANWPGTRFFARRLLCPGRRPGAHADEPRAGQSPAAASTRLISTRARAR